MKAPELWVVAGPNGAGKSTLVNTLLRRYLAHKIPFVNPDDIAAELDLKNRDTPAVQRRAGVQAIKDRNDHLANGRSFGIETTLSGNSTLNLMEKARAAGYRVKLVYVGIDDPDLSVGRVAARVGTGGHNVPADDALRRYPASLANLPKALLLADKSWVFDNTQESGRRLVLSRQGEKVRKVSRTLPEWAAKAIPAPLRSFGKGRGIEH